MGQRVKVTKVADLLEMDGDAVIDWIEKNRDMHIVTEKEMASMVDDGNWRLSLEGAGVDNWCGWDDAMEMYRSEDE